MSSDAVIQWQVDVLVKPAIAKGYDAIAWDNFGLGNSFKACGVYCGVKLITYMHMTSNTPIKYLSLCICSM